jgi:hypothetical protein
VWIERDGSGMWEVEVPDRHARVRCETLDDARRVAYLYAARKRACELIVRDAYQRVVYHEHLNEDRDPASQQPSREAS